MSIFKLDFAHHVKEKQKKAIRRNNIARKLHSILLRHSLLTTDIYIKVHMLVSILTMEISSLYDQPNNVSICKNIENLQYQPCLATHFFIRTNHIRT